VYSAGNFIEATRETCFFQIGESKYGKPILDRVLVPGTELDEAAKCALVSMDSTIRSTSASASPGPARLRAGPLRCDRQAVSTTTPLLPMIHSTWAQRLREVFESIDDPHWGDGEAPFPLAAPNPRYEVMRKIRHPGERIV
jgi:putative proteasome-type protease